MKPLKYLAVALSAMAMDVSAETIDTHVAGANYLGKAAGTATAACTKVVFFTRNSGTLVTGLTAGKFREVASQQTLMAPPKPTTSPVSIGFSVGAVGATNPGVYLFCLSPVRFTWTSGALYQFEFVVDGVNAADHGVFSITFSN